MQQIHCPNCGHHIVTIATPSEQRHEAQTPIVDEVEKFIAPRRGRGRVKPIDLYSDYLGAGGRASNRQFGLALRELGLERVASSGNRYWVL